LHHPLRVRVGVRIQSLLAARSLALRDLGLARCS
jgi:hypothetical protein